MSEAVVFGGYGTFGSRVCRELARRGVTVTVAGRDEARASAFAASLGAGHASVRADVRGLGDCRRALHGARVSVVCAGPFSELGAAALEAALAEGCHHIDLADDRAYVARAQACGPHFARGRRSVISGCSSLPALSCALAESAAAGVAEAPQAARLTLFIGNDNPKGVAATASAVAGLGRPIVAPQGLLHGMREPELVVLPPPFGRRRVYSFEAPDYDLLPALLGVRDVKVKVGFELRTATALFAMLARVPAFAHRLAGPLAAAGGLLRGLGSSGGVVMAELFWPDGTRRARAIVARTEGQQMAALPAVLVAEALLRRPMARHGALRPDDVLGRGGLLEGMAQGGLAAMRVDTLLLDAGGVHVSEREPATWHAVCKEDSQDARHPLTGGLMHEDTKQQIKGVGEQIEGKIKEEVGDVTGNKSLEIKGKIEKNVGHVREDVGRAMENDRKGRV